MDGQLGKKYLKEYTLEIYPYIDELLRKEAEEAKKSGETPSELINKFREIALQGKGIRSGLINLAYLACGGTEIEKIKKTSIFIEIFHTGILVHDDFMDSSDFRRGIKTVHKEFERIGEDLKVKIPADHYGNTMAVNVGDFAYFLSWELLVNSDFPIENIKRASAIFTDSARRLVHGQVMDLTLTGNENVTEEDILNMLWIKSGDYSARLPMLLGAALAGEKDEAKIEAIKEYTKCLGWAFQIQDDLLGAFGEEVELGKPVGSDFVEGKNTLLILHLRKNGSEKQIKTLNSFIGKKDISEKEAESVKQTLIDAGSKDYVTTLGWNYVEEGKKYIPSITKDKELQNILESLLIFMMERTK